MMIWFPAASMILGGVLWLAAERDGTKEEIRGAFFLTAASLAFLAAGTAALFLREPAAEVVYLLPSFAASLRAMRWAIRALNGSGRG